jgi:ubiquinone/menaquinone biosynthesis C-methylase UbiE
VNATSSQAQFDANAARYAQSELHRQGPSLPVLLRLAEAVAQDHVLDVATGTGNTAFALALHTTHVIGVDVSPKMLEQARTRATKDGVTNVQFLEAAAEQLPFPDCHFTLVTSRHAPHHFRDVQAFLHEVRRVLTPGGRFVLADQVTPQPEMTEWVDRWERLRDPSHAQQRTVEEWKALCEAAGLIWEQAEIVPYHMDFAWWVQQSGCTDVTIATLREHAQQADVHIRQAMGLTFDTDGQVIAHVEPMLVVRLSRA